MRVCVVAEYYPRRRDPVLGVWAHRQALAARDAGAEVRVLALERPIPPAAALSAAARGRPAALARELRAALAQPRRDTLDGIEVEYVRFLSPPRGTSYARWERYARRPLARALERLRRKWPFDLIHAHYALPAGGAALPFARRAGIPLVVSIHGGDVHGPLVQAPAARARIGGVLRECALVICNSRGTLLRAARVAGSAERMRVVHLGADAPASLPPRLREPTLVTLAHVIPRKRHEDVLRALPRLARTLPEIRWLVIGDGPARPRLAALARELGVRERVTFAGQLDHAAALDRLARCHAMAMPSVDEAFGVAYVEALARGVPAVGCRGEDGPEEIARLCEGMLLVPPRDPPSLASALAGLLGDAEQLERLSEAARRSARERFSWERCGRETVAAYERALAGAAR
ncbi:MAG: glycosyltransferase [Thermoleophilaceae bacterium]|nr:glycosyltransferase [Thermoleophilaceae bacterium]